MPQPRTAFRAWIILAALFPVMLDGQSAIAQQVGRTVAPRGTINQDIYLAGGTIDVNADVHGDVVAAGGQIVIERRVEGDVLAAGGDIEVGADVLDDVRAAGGVVTLRGTVAGDAVVAGGTVVLAPDANVSGRAWFGGGDVDVAGHVGTNLKAAGGTIVISGIVDGNVDLTGEQIDILPTARIAGALVYHSRRNAHIDPAAEIRGGVTHVPVQGASRSGQIAWRLFSTTAVGLLGAVLLLAFPGFAAGAVQSLSDRPWGALGIGAASLVGGPLLGAVLMVTLLGFALGVAVLVLYAVSLAVGFLVGALCLGVLAFRLTSSGAPVSLGGWIGALAVGLLVIFVAGWVPILGALVGLGVVLFGLGAVVRQTWVAWRGARGGAVAPA